MKIIIFELWGKFAHFRKFYTNSSSLSYSVPPRTTVEGIIAAILGYERDSYYEILNVDKLGIAVEKVSRTRKIMQSLNYIRATSPGDIISPKEHTQIPFELLTGDTNIRYRFYVTHKDKNILEDIQSRVLNNNPVYPLCFGSAPFGCYIDYVDSVVGKWIESNEYETVTTVINNEKIEEIDMENIQGSLIKERMPRDFGEGRIINELGTYVYEESGNPLKVKIKGEYLKLSNGENIVLL